MEKIKVMLDDGAYTPTRAHSADAGLDLYATKDAVIFRDGSETFDTGVHIAIPEGYVGFLKSKSGLNINSGLQSAGVIDSGYTGSIRVKLYNHGHEMIQIKRGQKISQLVILPSQHPVSRSLMNLKRLSVAITALDRAVRIMKQHERICKLCGKAFYVDKLSRSEYCSNECRVERNKIRCRNYYLDLKNGVKKKAERSGAPERAMVKIKITADIPVFDHMRPTKGAVYEVEKTDNGQYAGQYSYIIHDIGKLGLVVRADECEEVGDSA